MVTDYPTKGIRGLICGQAHNLERELKSYKKYQRAIYNKVPIVTMDSLPCAIGSTATELEQNIKDLKKEITIKRSGDKKAITHFIWKDVSRFILLSDPAFFALSSKDYDSEYLKYGDSNFSLVVRAALLKLKKNANDI